MLNNNNFGLNFLDLRNNPTAKAYAKAYNEALFVSGNVVWGIELSIAEWAARCEVNIDPQHEGGRTDVCALEVALTCPLPPAGVQFVGVRPDLDTFAAVEVLRIRSAGKKFLAEAVARLMAIAKADKFANGPWLGPQPLPTQNNPWPETGRRELAAINAAIMDHAVPVNTRQECFSDWLLCDQEPDGYRAKVEAERLDMVRALEAGEIQVSLHHNGRVAMVRSLHKAGTMVGYLHAPVALVWNPEFRGMAGNLPPHLKWTLVQYQEGYADLKPGLLGVLQAGTATHVGEPGCGGSATNINSTQGESSVWTADEVVVELEKFLLK